ncbi:hypothetical protein M899_2753 [Bacteriovorax sp. BSW11_IV]|uniref:hypothetical protein n=1 Tax=Bacteriovorax sp. BSW11_IV TaxID=1353529 RepID=UPI00038A535E|nr:hypothetical protein [Bacteriovorax sp. BSW11_IV]EQC49047.1 hypothetical protein M899_2753 [Bacteriovorax sp. BSW11_IV]
MTVNRPVWNELKNQILSHRFALPKTNAKLGHYEVISVLTDEQGRPKKVKGTGEKTECYLAFSGRNELGKIAREFSIGDLSQKIYTDFSTQHLQLRPYMIGDLINEIHNDKNIEVIKFNPVLYKGDNGTSEYLCEEIIIAPLYDQLTQKQMVTDPEEALALLAINPQDQKRIGLEIVFYSITNKLLPENKEHREEILKNKIEELAFYAPRVPIKRGSGSLFAVLLNLDNIMEETAFIRQYKTFDSYSNIIFVTSDLNIRTGSYETIPYNGDHIDSVFLPIIKWQRGMAGTIY